MGYQWRYHPAMQAVIDTLATDGSVRCIVSGFDRQAGRRGRTASTGEIPQRHDDLQRLSPCGPSCGLVGKAAVTGFLRHDGRLSDGLRQHGDTGEYDHHSDHGRTMPMERPTCSPSSRTNGAARSCPTRSHRDSRWILPAPGRQQARSSIAAPGPGYARTSGNGGHHS